MGMIGMLLGFSVVAMLMGKRASRVSAGWYVAVAVITAAQIAFALFKMFTMPIPIH